MDTNKILTADLLDLIFDERNKDYGAYDLRKTYHRRIKKAMIFTGSILTLLITGSLLANSLGPKKSAVVTISDGYILDKIDEEKPPVPELPKPKPQPVEPVHTVQFTQPILVEEVDQPPPTVEEVTTTVIDVKPQEGVDGPGIITPVDNHTGIIETKKEEPTGPFTVVEIDAKFPGDWGKFLERNLNPNTPIDNGAPSGDYTVLLQFVVDLNGNISDIKAISNVGYGMEKEAIRVLKKANKWIPAIQNGRSVPAYRRQPITFRVRDNE
jgi:protein TonB